MEGVLSALIKGVAAQIAGSTVSCDGDGVCFDLSSERIKAFESHSDGLLDVRSFTARSLQTDRPLACCDRCIEQLDTRVVLTPFTTKTDKIQRLTASDGAVN